jgi:translocator protein
MPNTPSQADRILSFAVPAATVLTIIVNALASVGYINDVSPAAVSEKYPTIITPAGYAFSIWSLIYVGMIAFSIYQMLPTKAANFRSVRMPYILSCILNCAWIFAWHHDLIGISFLIIVALAVTLFWICFALRETGSYLDSLFSKAPFGIYFGWLTCATLVNVFVLLRANGFDAQSTFLGVIAIIAATACAILVRWKLTNFLYPVAVAWALTAIAVKQSGNTPIVLAAAFGTVTCLVTAGSVVTGLKDSTSE